MITATALSSIWLFQQRCFFLFCFFLFCLAGLDTKVFSHRGYSQTFNITDAWYNCTYSNCIDMGFE